MHKRRSESHLLAWNMEILWRKSKQTPRSSRVWLWRQMWLPKLWRTQLGLRKSRLGSSLSTWSQLSKRSALTWRRMSLSWTLQLTSSSNLGSIRRTRRAWAEQKSCNQFRLSIVTLKFAKLTATLRKSSKPTKKRKLKLINKMKIQ